MQIAPRGKDWRILASEFCVDPAPALLQEPQCRIPVGSADELTRPLIVADQDGELITGSGSRPLVSFDSQRRQIDVAELVHQLACRRISLGQQPEYSLAFQPLSGVPGKSEICQQWRKLCAEFAELDRVPQLRHRVDLGRKLSEIPRC